MKRIALALLAAAALIYALATFVETRHPDWTALGYLAAFAEAAMVGAVADWFAVVALFRHPLGLPIPHTAIIPANKNRIGDRLADFICDNFLATPQVLAKLAQFDPAARLAAALAKPVNAGRIGEWGVAAMRYGLAAFDDARVSAFLRNAVATGLGRVDLSVLLGRALGAMTAGGRHQALLDDLLVEVAGWIESDALQEQVADVIAKEIRALRWVGLDQKAARLATRKLVVAVARTINEVADHPEATGADATPHPLRQRFDHFMHDFIDRLQNDPEFIARGAQIRAELIAHPALVDYLQGLWDELRRWLDADLAQPDSAIRVRIAALAAGLGERLAGDAEIRRWINEQITAAAPRAIARWRHDIRRYISTTVAGWDAGEMTRELERHIGRDLQFIRINGTLVGGLVGLTIHALTVWLRA